MNDIRGYRIFHKYLDLWEKATYDVEHDSDDVCLHFMSRE